MKYELHLMKHADDSLKCLTCNKSFKSSSTLQKHMNMHNGIKFTCTVCGLMVSSKTVLERHLRRHKGEYSHKCGECGKEYYNTKAYNHHMEAEHAGIRYPCDICGSVLRSKRYYKDHLANHSNKDARTFECSVCHKYYSTKSALNGHMRIHSSNRYVCDICGKKSIQIGAHKSHMRMHAGEKSYICDMCGKDFLRKDVLDQHMRRVHETTKIPCEKCGEIFITEYKLMVHLHTHDDVEKPFPCQLCPEKFIDKNFLRHHVNKVHIEHKDAKQLPAPQKAKPRRGKAEKRFFCDECDAAFSSAVGFGNHKKTHSSYICNICKVRFGDVKELRAHLELHRREFDDELSDDDEFVDDSCDETTLAEDQPPYAVHEVTVEDIVTY